MFKVEILEIHAFLCTLDPLGLTGPIEGSKCNAGEYASCKREKTTGYGWAFNVFLQTRLGRWQRRLVQASLDVLASSHRPHAGRPLGGRSRDEKKTILKF